MTDALKAAHDCCPCRMFTDTGVICPAEDCRCAPASVRLSSSAGDQPCQWPGHAALNKAVEEANERAQVAEINYQEGQECAADLFALVCSVLDNKPEANDARLRLQKHVEHVRSCRKGSCDTELHGSDLRKQALSAERERGRREMRDAVFAVGCEQGCPCCVACYDAAKALLKEPAQEECRECRITKDNEHPFHKARP